MSFRSLTLTSTNSPAFPPATDTIVFFKQIDWREVGQRCRGGLNNVGLILAVIGEKIHDAGAFLAQV